MEKTIVGVSVLAFFALLIIGCPPASDPVTGTWLRTSLGGVDVTAEDDHYTFTSGLFSGGKITVSSSTHSGSTVSSYTIDGDKITIANGESNGLTDETYTFKISGDIMTWTHSDGSEADVFRRDT